MSKPGADPSSGISLGDALRLPKRHPACRRREAQSGSCMERENLAGDVKGKGASGSNREAESTDAPERGGLPRSSSPPGFARRDGALNLTGVAHVNCAHLDMQRRCNGLDGCELADADRHGIAENCGSRYAGRDLLEQFQRVARCSASTAGAPTVTRTSGISVISSAEYLR